MSSDNTLLRVTTILFITSNNKNLIDLFDLMFQTANGIMITRQELGSDITPKKLVIAQKNMIARANKVNYPKI